MNDCLLQEILAEGQAEDPGFAERVQEAIQRRQIGHRLRQSREAAGITQLVLAAKMGTCGSMISKIENGGDVKLSSLQRYCTALGVASPLQVPFPGPLLRVR